MALINCPACQNPVAANAPNCPKCGAPIKKKSRFSILRVLVLLPLVFGLIVSLANGWLIGIIASAILLLLVALSK